MSSATSTEDFEAQRKKRMEALEEKKKRLQAMKQSREVKSATNEGFKSTYSDPDTLLKLKNDTSALVEDVMSRAEEDFSSSSSLNLNPSERFALFTRVKGIGGIDMMPAGRQTHEISTEMEKDAFPDEHSKHTTATPTPTHKSAGTSSTSTSPGKKNVKKVEKKVLSAAEYQKTVSKGSFKAFLAKAMPHVYDALEQTDSSDIIRDYSSKSEVKSKSKTFRIHDPYYVESLKNRPIMDIKWSALKPELFLVAYGERIEKKSIGVSETKSSEGYDTPGLVYIWNRDASNAHTKPEQRFTSSSPVMSALFHNKEPNLVIGGCYNGQILLWDMNGKALAISRSSMSGKGHKHPVYAMSMISSSDKELVSVSTDGMLCHWDTTRLQDPLITVFLNYPSPQSSLPGYFELGDGDSKGPLNVCSMAFEKTDSTTNILFGTGSGQVFRSNLPYRPTNPPLNELYAHKGLVSSIRPHCSPSKLYQSLLLTSSLDWTVKLWSLSSLAKPLFEFVTPAYDYVCDVQWSPDNSAIFSAITSSGRLILWNVAKSASPLLDEINILETIHEREAAINADKFTGKKSDGALPLGALNKSLWAQDGMSLLVGDSMGRVHVISMTKSQVEVNKTEEDLFEKSIAAIEREAQAAKVKDSKKGKVVPKKK